MYVRTKLQRKNQIILLDIWKSKYITLLKFLIKKFGNLELVYMEYWYKNS